MHGLVDVDRVRTVEVRTVEVRTVDWSDHGGLLRGRIGRKVSRL
jgi:hypothetical protein